MEVLSQCICHIHHALRNLLNPKLSQALNISDKTETQEMAKIHLQWHRRVIIKDPSHYAIWRCRSAVSVYSLTCDQAFLTFFITAERYLPAATKNIRDAWSQVLYSSYPPFLKKFINSKLSKPWNKELKQRRRRGRHLVKNEFIFYKRLFSIQQWLWKRAQTEYIMTEFNFK